MAKLTESIGEIHPCHKNDRKNDPYEDAEIIRRCRQILPRKIGKADVRDATYRRGHPYVGESPILV
jgi:hypothetical protein